MPTLYHFDTWNRLRPGQMLRCRPVDRHASLAALAWLTPNGLTPHSQTRLLPIERLNADGWGWSVLEHAFELVRREYHRGAPSRFDVLFACDDLAFLADGRAKLVASGLKPGAIYELETRTEPYRADMT